MKKSLSKMKKKAWAAFSKWYRQSHSDDNGYATCYTCGVIKPWKELQVGHLLDGRNNAILFEINAVRIQCPGCNLFKNGNKEVYIPKFIQENGWEEYDRLRRLKNTTVKYSISDYEEMIEKWGALCV